MAVFRGDIRSGVLAMDTGLHVILPYDRPAEYQKEPCGVLYLLHGLGDNASAWCRYTRIECYAREKGIAVVMPEVQRSFYCDMAHGPDYFTYLTGELPELCARMFHLSRKREDTFVAGLSMGGYGALKCAFARPELYAGCASFSGAVDLVRALEEHSDERLAEEFRAVLGMDLHISGKDDLKCLARKLCRLPKGLRPSVYITCGTEDFLYDINTGFRKYLASLPLDFIYSEWPGDHNWDFWDTSVRQALDFFIP